MDKESNKDNKCKAVITEVLEHEEEEDGDRAQFSHVRNADNDVETCEDLSDSDIVGSISARLQSANAPRTTMMTTQTLSWTMCPSVAEAARALDVMQLFVEKKGLMDKLAFHLDGFENPDGDQDDLGKRPRLHTSSPASAFGEVGVRGTLRSPPMVSSGSRRNRDAAWEEGPHRNVDEGR
ncbi:hypothetical protein HPB50_003649 [Hyalomma asiaticum]|uniref:Uncharacterized protein n=1 Tax=Hyalomma asiaticum TaxID=266040 RepID=A0ACB7SC97_HYAAI|nr:hypothetical protein HPB50_003649 [Hyalomma asiaticum]